MTILTPTGGVDIRPYLEKMHGEVQKSWTAALPQAFYREEFGEAVEAVIKFRINRDGTIQNVSLEVSSGNDSLDQAALSGIRAASPVDALPQTFQGPWIEIRAPFQYKHAASRYKCPPPTGQTIGAPPFDRLELLAFLEGKNPADYEARVVCERGINFTPDYPLLTALRTSGAPRDLVNALAELKPTAEGSASPRRLDAYELLDSALILNSRKEFEAANDDFKGALRFADDSATLHLAYGNALLAARKYPDAEIQLHRSLELWPEDSDAHALLAFALLAQKRDREAVGEAREAVRIFPENEMGLIALGFSLSRTAQYKEAVPILRGVMSHATLLPAIHKFLGISLLHTGELDTAADQLNLFLKTNPNDAETHYFLGACLRAQGKKDEALAQFREAARIDPSPLYAATLDFEASKGVATEDSRPAGPHPNDSFISANIYTNTFFGFSYEFPKDFVIQKADIGKAMARMGISMLTDGDSTDSDMVEPIVRSSYQLFTATKQTIQNISTKTSVIQITAIDQRFSPELKSGGEYLNFIADIVKRKGFTVAGPPEQFSVDARTFWKSNVELQLGNKLVHEMLAVTIEKGYVLSFIFAGPDIPELDKLTRTMGSLRFTDSLRPRVGYSP
jgi:TonB family protein